MLEVGYEPHLQMTACQRKVQIGQALSVKQCILQLQVSPHKHLVLLETCLGRTPRTFAALAALDRTARWAEPVATAEEPGWDRPKDLGGQAVQQCH